MSFEIPNYTLTEQLYTGKHTLIYQGFQNADKTPVIFKITKEEYPSTHIIAQLKHEFAMTQIIHSSRVVKAYALETIGNRLVLITENFNGRPLEVIIKEGQIDIETFLTIAIELAQGIGDIHQHHIIHKDIKPHNIIVNLATKQVKVVDFGIATLLSREMQSITDPELMEGTFAYISPEQTGRINRPIDYRTDIYSLGVTLYEMITMKLPFQSSDFMELIHQHIAKQPVPPHQIDKYLPIAISDIIMKCMAKGPEERYHSAYGLKNDLEECLNQLNASGTIEPFSIGQNDIFDHFHIPQKLYGRENELKILMSAFERSSKGEALLLFVRGYAGIGKSSFVNEIQRPIVQKKGFFISGKFEQFKKNIPYYALIQAFTHLIQQLLVESDASLAKWRQRLLKTLGSNGQIMIEVIPELKLVIGAQPPVYPLEQQAEEIRFKETFSRFIETFLRPDNPLVIFLDDLQWADSASLKWLEALFTESSHLHLLVIGAYRDNEVDVTHPLSQTLREIAQAGKTFEILEIKPLSTEIITELIKDTTHDSYDRVYPLAQLVYQKTQGNPFFIIQFLKMLYEKNLLNFDPLQQRWKGNLAEIQKLRVTENVADFMSQKIQEFPPATLSLLKVAAAIGNTFDIHLLARTLRISFSQAITDLWLALQEEIISSQKNFYALERIKAMKVDTGIPILCTFQHDRIQQAAYQLIPPEERNALHYTIGRTLLFATPLEKRDEAIISIVNQLDYGISFINNEKELIEFAQLNLQAAKKAVNAGAYPSALSFYSTGIACLPENHWDTHYTLSYDLFEGYATCEFLLGDIQETEIKLEHLLKNVKTDFEKSKIYYLYTQLYINLGNSEKTIETGAKALNLLGENYVLTNLKGWILWEKIKLKWRFLFTSLDGVAQLPVTQDEVDYLVEHIYGTLQTATRFTYLSELNMLKAFNRILRRGVSDYSTYTISRYGMFLSWEKTQKYKLAYQIGIVATKVAERFNVPAATNIKLFTDIWGRHFNKIVPELKELADRSFTLGLIELASQYLFLEIFMMLMKGDVIPKVYEQLLINQKIAAKNKSTTWFYVLETLAQVCRCLQGLTEDPTDTSIQSTDPLIQNYAYPYPDLYTEAWPVFVYYIHEQYEPILEIAKKVEKYNNPFPGGLGWIHYYFYLALTLAAIYPSHKDKKSCRKNLQSLQKRIKKWADACPENHLHRYFLISAEVARCLGQNTNALNLYDNAIFEAKKNKFLHEEALAYELAGKLLLSLGKRKRAAYYLIAAYNAYANWGAISKLRQLEEKYWVILNLTITTQYKLKRSIEKKEDQLTSSVLTATTQLKTIAASGIFDSIAILQAAQTLSDEIVLDKLLTKLMNILLVIAGADRAFMILIKENRLMIQARQKVEQSGSMISLEEEPLDNEKNLLCTAVVHFVIRNNKEILLHDATNDPLFMHDPYVATTRVQSILCLPLMSQNRVIGVLYFENRLNKYAFKTAQVRVLSLLSLQMATSIENALFYANLETNVDKRTQEIKRAQNQLILKEKMVSLSTLTVNIAQGLNAPLENIDHNLQDCENLMQNINSFLKEHHSWSKNEMRKPFHDPFIDLEKNLGAIKEQEQRANRIVQRMLEHSQGQLEEEISSDIHKLLEEAIEVLLQAKKEQKLEQAVAIQKELDPSIPNLYIAPQAMKRVFFYLLDNAYYSVWQKKQKLKNGFSPLILIKTYNAIDHIEIRIRDNGLGISNNSLGKIFTPFFTTKPPGQGTGFGLSLSHQIISEYSGTLTFNTLEGEFAEFVITIPIRREL